MRDEAFGAAQQQLRVELLYVGVLKPAFGFQREVRPMFHLLIISVLAPLLLC